MATSKTYDGGCHCGDVKFKATLTPALDERTVLSCSICSINGYLMVYPKRKDVAFEDGSDAKLKPYTFATGKLEHLFCPTCGTSVMGRPKDPTAMGGILALNTRTFKDVDVDKLEKKFHNGRDQPLP
ncbi:MAG: hypothetical protein M1832_002117 [Thelocarpon impressellum]|nr:MAG: hypothetical protein M1832_002117 [Thelocarpon impressellum]